MSKPKSLILSSAIFREDPKLPKLYHLSTIFQSAFGCYLLLFQHFLFFYKVQKALPSGTMASCKVSNIF